MKISGAGKLTVFFLRNKPKRATSLPSITRLTKTSVRHFRGGKTEGAGLGKVKFSLTLDIQMPEAENERGWPNI